MLTNPIPNTNPDPDPDPNPKAYSCRYGARLSGVVW